VTLPILISLVVVYIIHTPAKILIPHHNGSIDSALDIGVYSDQDEGGRSRARLKELRNDRITWEYMLREEQDYTGSRYAGLYISLPDHTEDTHFDISEYTDLTLKLTLENTDRVFFYVRSFIDGFSRKGHSTTYARYRKLLFADENGRVSVHLKLDKFKVPDWWESQIDLDGTIELDPTRIIQFDIVNGQDTPTKEPVEITLHKFSAEKDLFYGSAKIIMIIILIANLLYFIIIFSWKFNLVHIMLEKISKDDDKIVISYDKVEMKDEQEEEVQRITEQISKNYFNPEFNVEQLSREAGVSTSKIPSLLKKKYSMNFKQYLNMVRITEAKRLLLETEHQIVSIAHSVGYNNIPHFNRTFKQYTGISPKKYRKNPEEAKNITEAINRNQKS
jgi:AraC-like DNA-binding protein